MSEATPSLPRKTFLQLAHTHLGACLGLACLLAWPWFTTSATMARSGSMTTSSVVWTGSNATYLYLALVGIALALAPGLAVRLIRRPAVFGATGVCYLFSSVAFLYLQTLDPAALQPFDRALMALWPIACGISQGFLYVCWIYVWGHVGPKVTVAIVVGASLAATGALVLATVAPIQLKMAVVMLTGPVGTAFAWRETHRLQPIPAPPTESPGTHRRRIPWKLCLSACAAGLGFGVFQSLALLGAFGATGWSTFAVPAFLLAAFLLALCVFNFKLNFNYMMYRVAFVLMGAGSFAVILAPMGSAWGYGLLCLGYRLFESICWCLCAYLIAYAHAVPAHVGGLCVGSLWGGRFVGFEIVTLLPHTEAVTTALFATVMFVCLMTALFFISHNNLVEAWGMKHPNEASSQDIALEQACASLAATFSLSNRETEVLFLVGKDLTRPQIGEELSLSSETVKSHLSHIYQKCSVHTRAELQELLGNERTLRERSSL